jgi:hypothetical protein
LPERRSTPMRARAATPEPDRFGDEGDRDDSPIVPLRKSGIPTLVKVVGAAVVILLGVYLLGRQRDRALTESPPAPEPPASGLPTLAPSSH